MNIIPLHFVILGHPFVGYPCRKTTDEAPPEKQGLILAHTDFLHRQFFRGTRPPEPKFWRADFQN